MDGATASENCTIQLKTVLVIYLFIYSLHNGAVNSVKS
jgi:hypothetical protein